MTTFDPRSELIELLDHWSISVDPDGIDALLQAGVWTPAAMSILGKILPKGNIQQYNVLRVGLQRIARLSSLEAIIHYRIRQHMVACTSDFSEEQWFSGPGRKTVREMALYGIVYPYGFIMIDGPLGFAVFPLLQKVPKFRFRGKRTFRNDPASTELFNLLVKGEPVFDFELCDLSPNYRKSLDLFIQGSVLLDGINVFPLSENRFRRTLHSENDTYITAYVLHLTSKIMDEKRTGD